MAVALGPLKDSRGTQRGLGYSSVVQRLPSMCKALESVPSATNKTMKRQLDRVATSPWLTLLRGEKHSSGEKGHASQRMEASGYSIGKKREVVPLECTQVC